MIDYGFRGLSVFCIAKTVKFFLQFVKPIGTLRFYKFEVNILLCKLFSS